MILFKLFGFLVGKGFFHLGSIPIASKVILHTKGFYNGLRIILLEDSHADISTNILEVINLVCKQFTHLLVPKEGCLHRINVRAKVSQSP